jgi:uncharacterized protein (DUF488 family)
MDIYTIGHSTRTIKNFINILLDDDIEYVVDVRSYPGSTRYPQFNKARLKNSLAKYGIKYKHIPDLGGRRNLKTTIHTSIHEKAFASYAQYMMTNDFKRGLRELKKIAKMYKTVIMCSEALWWRCHRRMISDRLEYDGWQVYHLGISKEPIRHHIWDISRLNNKREIIYDG